MTLRQMVKVLAVLLAAFPAFRPKVELEQMEDAYRAILGDLEPDLVMQAAVHYASAHTFFPSAGELRAAYFELGEQARGVPSAQDAWHEVSGRLSRGFHRSLMVQAGPGHVQGTMVPCGEWEVGRLPVAADWTHPLIQKAIDGVGGWQQLRISDNRVADRARFIQAFEAYLERGRTDQRMLPAVRKAVAALAGRGAERIAQEAGA